MSTELAKATNDEFGYVTILKIEGSIELHKKISQEQAEPQALDTRKIQSYVLMNQRNTIEESVEAVKQKILKLNELLKDFKDGELIYDSRIRSGEAIGIGPLPTPAAKAT